MQVGRLFIGEPELPEVGADLADHQLSDTAFFRVLRATGGEVPSQREHVRMIERFEPR